MASTINAKTTGTGGIEYTADASGEIELQSDGVTKAKVTANGLQDANGNSLRGGSFRNLIINGDMKIAQRGTSATGNTGSGYLTVDRFAWYQSGTLTTNHSQSTDVPSGQGFTNSWKVENTTAFSPTGTEQARLDYRFEGQYLQHLAYGTSNAKTMTISFWVKSSVTGTAHVWLYQGDSGSPSVTSVRTRADAFTINSANTWEKKTITIEGDTSGQIDNDNGNGLYLIWTFGFGSDYTSGTKQDGWYSMANATNRVDLLAGQTNFFASANQTIYLTGVQLEVGEGASDFEFLPYDVELARCLRYYYKNNGNGSSGMYGMGHCRSNYLRGMLWLPVPMRTGPTMSNTGTDSDYVLNSGTTDYTSFVTRPSADASNPYSVNFRVQVSSLTNGSCAIIAMNSSNSYLAFDAEL